MKAAWFISEECVGNHIFHCSKLLQDVQNKSRAKKSIVQNNYIKVWKKHEQGPLPYADDNSRTYNTYFLNSGYDNCCLYTQ